MKKIAVMMPTRSAGGKRDLAARDAFASWECTTSGNSDFYYGMDTDDYRNYTVPAGAASIVNERLRLVPKLNKMASQLQDAYDYLLFIGDDHRFISCGWEEAFLTGAAGGDAIFYGNDLLQGEKLPTAVFISSGITKSLGFMAPPCIQHMYADNFWKEAGEALGVLRYYPDVVIEHRHFSVRKSNIDTQYIEVARLHYSDEIAYKAYKQSGFAHDIARAAANIIATGGVK